MIFGLKDYRKCETNPKPIRGLKCPRKVHFLFHQKKTQYVFTILWKAEHIQHWGAANGISPLKWLVIFNQCTSNLYHQLLSLMCLQNKTNLCFYCNKIYIKLEELKKNLPPFRLYIHTNIRSIRWLFIDQRRKSMSLNLTVKMLNAVVTEPFTGIQNKIWQHNSKNIMSQLHFLYIRNII